MAKQNPTDTTVANTQEPRLTLSEFCTRLSEKVSRPELLGGFEFVERRAGRIKDVESAYQARFDAFVKTPV